MKLSVASPVIVIERFHAKKDDENLLVGLKTLSGEWSETLFTCGLEPGGKLVIRIDKDDA